ncbi:MULTISPECIES: prepilin-type N-terminal cleavage/methylation domain-containing protein [unclassified Janthinobacterium]|uniref:prepilin-type N-terminal cleavage/methylation domain-containing protein n=1 Tax=unclassified Janthinobacterium TaxID=2610881 RepID=UPI00161BCF42|nr:MULTISPECIES: prepilin-type N-terminal cleavage/methylation domain-containing protein [unclassified Janthinobacterium]MBB5609560.1 prepilin-type N-terminal cleavage/methylation domain-containing protein [Janthinobacterium sp. S3T4]MBB5614593.1 prepilin-type N-terminal cleavage/methylation domain-containing protein [Janthinobacterium sp. S3M3]
MKPQHQAGFSLIEIAIVLVIVGLMIGGLVTPLTVQLEQRKVAETQKALDDAREALTGFAVRYGYLPCPAISAMNGLEDRNGGRCTEEKRAGFLPWTTLGLGKSDSWNNLFRYSVTPAFSDSEQQFGLGTPRDISVATRDGGPLTQATALNDIPAVIMSHGKNGFGATSAQGQRRVGLAVAGNLDERNNIASDTLFISRAGSTGLQAGGSFDDMVVWLSPNILFNRMVTAQRLPR